MSDSEGTAHLHPTTAGKSLEAAERPRYKSWRKKYRKVRHKFEGVYEENKSLFKEEQKLEGIASRLREELDGLRDILLDLNANPALPPELRYKVSLLDEHTAVGSIPSVVRDDVTPDAANTMLADYKAAVQRGQIPHLDMHVIREQIEKKLAVQGVLTLDELESSVSHPRPDPDANTLEDLQGPAPPGFLTSDQEDAYLLRLDAKCGDPVSATKLQEKENDDIEHKHWADLTPREIERRVELLNPMSQHNWLKRHAKQSGPVEIDDNESTASLDNNKPTPSRGGGGGKRNLAKLVGDRAVGRAREGLSPSATSFGDEDELAFVDEHPQGKKRKDPDSTYRVKGGKSGFGKGKRKRGSEESAGSGKKAKMEASE